MKALFKLFLLLFLGGMAQNANSQQYDRIPEKYRSHPELGKTAHAVLLHEPAYELVHRRTKYSRTFLNKNTTQTTVQSSSPLHYQDEKGFWRSIDYKAVKKGNTISYPAQQPFFAIDSKATSILVDGQRLVLLQRPRISFTDDADSKITSINTNTPNPKLEDDNVILFDGVNDYVSKKVSLYQGVMKYSYIVQSPALFPNQFDTMILSEGFALSPDFEVYKRNGSIVVSNSKGVVLEFHPPVITDASQPVRGIRKPSYEPEFELTKMGHSEYKISLSIDGDWLKSPDRVFPITIDPVVTLENNDVVNSCFTPTYEQAILEVDVPSGESVLSSHFTYDFVAVDGSGAWMADQRSFVSGPSGQTPVQMGTGNSAGTQNYDIPDSDIGNGVSTGQVTYTFNFGRNWGGSGCNATYNFVSHHEVAVTYGTIEFGDGPLLINEYSASNRFFNDSFDRNEDWIELYNASPDTYFNLAGYHISNNANNPTKWQIESGVIPPNSRFMIYCSNRDITSGAELHASFDLTQTDDEPDDIVIADPSGNILQSLVMFKTQTNHSYGRTTDGADTWSVFETATPGQANAASASNYATKPTFDLAPGRYGGSINVSLSSSGSNEQIRYTVNGSTPSATSTLYTGPINVSQTTVIRARAFSTVTGILPGFIETNTYFINENTSLPTVSLAGDGNLMQLFNGTQIEPIGYFEYFENDGTFVDETMGDFDKHGNDSWAYDQRGVDFIARDDHGYKRRMEHQFFNTSPRGTYRRLILKAGGSDNYPHQDGGGHMRDVFAQKLSEVADLELDERRSTFVSLFVNGQYWGVYDMREKVDDNQYTDYYYNQDYIFRDSDLYIQYIKTWGSTLPEFGNQPAIDAWNELTDFVQNNDMALEANYNYVDSQLNIDSLIDYFVLNSYLVNKDWLNWNTSWWRGLDPSGGALKWRYALWDMDGILGHYINYTGIPDITSDAPPCQAEEIEVGVGHTQTIGKLIEENASVRQRYVTRYADLLNTHLSCDEVTAVFDAIVAEITPEMPRQIARWGGSMDQWQANIQEAREFLLERCSQTLANGMEDCYQVTGPYETIFNVEPVNTGTIRMNSEWIAEYPFTANIFGNIETLLLAEANTGYEFSHWVVDGATINPNDESADIMLMISQATTVTAHFTEMTNENQALYYWHFNTLVTPADVTQIPADYSQIPGASPLMTYTGSGARDIDAASPGSILNTHFGEISGTCARVRNPSEGRSLVFDLPTTGFKDIEFAYAVHRTNNGQLNNIIEYSIDGTNFTQEGLSQTSFPIAVDFGLIEIDFTSILAVNNNENFKIRITFEGNNTGDSGNNRFDNITLKGVENDLAISGTDLTRYQIYPNPFKDNVQIITADEMTELTVFDMVGKKVWQGSASQTTSETIDLGALNAGMYLLKIKTSGGTITHKLIRR